MEKLMDIHFSFLCRSTRTNKEGLSPIVLRIIYGQQRRDIFTGLHSPLSEWDPKAMQVGHGSKDADTINENLKRITYKATRLFDQLQFSGSPFTTDEFVRKLKGKGEQPMLLVDYLASRIKDMAKRTGTEISKATYRKYERNYRFVCDFVASVLKEKKYFLIRIDTRFLEEFFQYLRTIRKNSNNSAVKNLSFLRSLLMPAIQSNTIRQNPFRQLKLRIKVVPKGFLTDEELNLLERASLGSPDLERIRDQYLFCCFTGLAYCDLKQIRRDHFIKQSEGEFYILKPRQKTGQDSIIPLLPAAKRILQAYSLTNDFRDFIWHVSANQKMNQRLKTIGEKAGLQKTLHMHLARHTFATTVTLSKGVPIESVSSMLGHASIRQTQHYAKVVALKVMKDMSLIREAYK